MKTCLIPLAVRSLAAVLVLTFAPALRAAPGDSGIGTGPPPPLLPPLFQPLGFLSGTPFQSSNASALSANGRVVVGDGYRTNFNYHCAFRWTQPGGMVPIVTTGDVSYARGVSSNGAVVVGWRHTPVGAFRWISGTGANSLPTGSQYGQLAFAASADGNVIVGMHNWYGTEFDVAVKWVGNGGPQFLGLLPGGDSSRALAVSADGSAVVGHGTTDSDLYELRRAFRHTSATGLVSLGDLPGGLVHSSATGVSGDGDVVTGFGTTGSTSNDNEAFLWMPRTGMVGLGQPLYGVKSKGLAISPAGTIIVGSARPILSPDTAAIIWDADHGMRWLKPILTAQYGLTSALQGWTLTSAVGVVDSGSYVYLAGNGVNPAGKAEAWWARLPGPLQ